MGTVNEPTMTEDLIRRCPTCNSSAPHLHPAVQFEGEVEYCTHDFHLRGTPQNKPEYIAAVLAKRAAQLLEQTARPPVLSEEEVAHILRDTLSVGEGLEDGQRVTFVAGIQESAAFIISEILSRLPQPQQVPDGFSLEERGIIREELEARCEQRDLRACEAEGMDYPTAYHERRIEILKRLDAMLAAAPQAQQAATSGEAG